MTATSPHDPNIGGACPSPPDLAQVVAHNFRAARKLRGWTQNETAEHLAPYLGRRPTQAGVSAIEMGRARRFDVDKLVAFTLTFDLPLAWFLLPPTADTRKGAMTGGVHPAVIGSERDVAPFYRRVSELDARQSHAGAATVPDTAGPRSRATTRAKRRQMLGAWCEENADHLASAVEEIGRLLDELRRIGMRAYTDEAFREILAASDRQGPAAATETGGHAQPVDTPWLSDRPTELGQLAILDERFCAELSVWDVDMLVRGLICWSRDPFWDDVEPEEASCILDELRDLEQRVRAVVPPATVTSYERLIFTTLLDDELRCAHDDLRDGRDGLM